MNRRERASKRVNTFRDVLRRVRNLERLPGVSQSLKEQEREDVRETRAAEHAAEREAENAERHARSLDEREAEMNRREAELAQRDATPRTDPPFPVRGDS